MNSPREYNRITEDRMLLTVREQEIANLIALGYRNDIIAKEINISIGTVKAHICNIMRKFNLHSRTQIAMLKTSTQLFISGRRVWPIQ
ncbi:response regulator transcription factor [Methylobacterium sp. P31]